MEVLFKASNLSKTIQSKNLFENASFEIYDSNCIGLLGPNGCGKTTLLKIILGWDKPTNGDLWKKNDLKIRYLDQVAMNPFDKTVYDFFIRTSQSNNINQQIKNYENQLEDQDIYNTNKYEEIIENIRRLQVHVNRSDISSIWDSTIKILEEIGLDDLTLSSEISSLSGGERQKIAIASILAKPKDCELLLLDEPTNHLDIETIEWLEEQLADFPSGIIIISHDRYLLDDLVDRVFEINNKSIEIYNAVFEEYEEQKKLRQHIKEQEYKKSKAEIQRQKTIIETLTRRNRYDRQIASKIKRMEKQNDIENPILKSYLLKFKFKTIFKSGKNVADGNNLKKKFVDKIILNNANFEIFAGQKIGLIGPNGCGKTTFLKILMGEERIDEGKINLSAGVISGYFDQGHLSLNFDNNLIDEVIRDQKNLSENDAKALLGQFNFKGNIIYNQIKQLSGGERARLAILRLLLQPYNFLILDEPTNHMDMDSKVSIEQALKSYTGSVIVVSHDRRFLDNIVDMIFFMDNGIIKMYNGNYSSFRIQRQKELTDFSDSSLAYLSTIGLKKYVVNKSFTCWTSKKKHKVGEEIFIGDHNEKIYEWAIKANYLQLVKKIKK